VRALVVDDEAPARRRLARQLAELGVEVCGEAEDGEGALRAARQLVPDVLFLDVRMPGLDGLSLAQRYAGLPPIVFCTAYDEFAVRAFEVNAVDYLLKPVRPERLAAAVEKVRARAEGAGASPGQGAALAGLTPGNTRVVSAARGEVRFFDAGTVTRFWASEKYTLFLADGQEQLTEESLADLEARLGGLGFVRVHRGELVRASAVKALRSEAGGHEVELADGQVARVSRRSVESLRQALALAPRR
jgi:DNA-binding LytR/AlgR family response regulator